ncbi:hypothetical protein SAMN04487859_1383 [Roseovarius lutimaris]|uniref:PD(D/E)XK endonuclease domain-containing protein n=1 Tax=Roseovarius lutimaris TaxID=1005928 RepID=A0A1I5GRT5_9RHOB|nr:hypothetical protein [Roseovarius lutimaris]SFO38702.1 hypothetical protein SAMN04487859_1383 [Roseovarius lutimaris]
MFKQPPLSGFEALFASRAAHLSADDIRQFPDLSPDMLTRHAKWFGLSGEHLVDSILLRFGIYTSQLPEMLPADRIVYHPDGDLRLQIKTCCRSRNGYFHFSLTKGYHRSPTGVKSYAPDDFDIVALVALSENVVKFTADRHQSHRIALSEIDSLRTDPCSSLERAVKDLSLSAASVSIPAPTPAPVIDDGRGL